MIVKHTNPCGVASKGDLLEAYRLAVRADPVSAFGGIVAFNTVVDEKLAKEIREFRCVECTVRTRERGTILGRGFQVCTPVISSAQSGPAKQGDSENVRASQRL